jgi:hypothetical protein
VVLSSGSFKLKVMLAQAPHSRHVPFALSVHEHECYTWHVHEGRSVTRMGAGACPRIYSDAILVLDASSILCMWCENFIWIHGLL